MKILAIGDIHGRPEWKSIVAQNQYDQIVFMGDYFDSKEGIPFTIQKKNFIELLEFKKGNSGNVVLLIGNHDFHYFADSEQTYSGFQSKHQKTISKLLESARKENLIQVCHRHLNYLFVHAGLSKTWVKKAFSKNLVKDNLCETVNHLLTLKTHALGFSPGREYDGYGDEPCQSPLWIRPKSLLKDRIDGYVQVVGHTPQAKLLITEDVIFIDTLGQTGEYLVIEDGVPTAHCL